MHHLSGSHSTGPVADGTVGDGTGQGDRYERVALSIYTSTFHDADHPSPLAPENLRYDEAVNAVRAGLERLGYQVTAVDDQAADVIADAVDQWLTQTARPGVLRIVHVLSHGVPGELTGYVQVAGQYGTVTTRTELARWLGTAAQDNHGAKTLFLVDLCYAGEMAVQPWDQRQTAAERAAWVVAATAPGEPAFSARLTKALAIIIDRIARRQLTSREPDAAAVDLATVVRHLQAQVLQLPPLAVGQQVYASRVGVGEQVPAVPFFPLPDAGGPRRHRAHIDANLLPYLDTVDELIDPAHFIGRARSLPGGGTADTRSCFTGRGDQVRRLTAWLDGTEPGTLRVVTGSPGSGKSALLGVLICAAHPQLRPSSAWHTIRPAPAKNPNLAAIHARHRDLAAIRAGIARQLDLPADAATTTAVVSTSPVPTGAMVSDVRAPAPDVEALLVDRRRRNRDHWLVPIDDCHRLVAVLRTRWKGLAGGPQVWAALTEFFDELRGRARTVPARSSKGAPA